MKQVTPRIGQALIVALCCVATIFIISCGSSSPKKITTSTVSGVFADAPVTGLNYSCGTTTGTTGTGGSFTCPTNSTVAFTVGPVTICSAPVQPFMTPVSCAQANGNPTADASTPSVLATAQFMISIGTPAGTPPGTLSTLTITPAEVTAAAGLSLDFSTATTADLTAAVGQVNPGQTLVDATTAQTELTGTIASSVAGSYSGSYSGDDTGTWSITSDNNGNVTGSFTNKNGTGTITGSLVNGTTYSGTADSATWTGTVDTSKGPTTGTGPYLFSGSWTNTVNPATGTFTN